MADYPTIAEELHRKSLDALIWLAEEHEKGKIDDVQMYIAVEAIFKAVSGLVPQDVFELMSMRDPRRSK
jgi:hypothetical protein